MIKILKVGEPFKEVEDKEKVVKLICYFGKPYQHVYTWIGRDCFLVEDPFGAGSYKFRPTILNY